MAYFGALLSFGLRQYSRACPICRACTCSLQEGNFISSDGAHEIGGVKGVSGVLSWQPESDRTSGLHD